LKACLAIFPKGFAAIYIPLQFYYFCHLQEDRIHWTTSITITLS
jgi:heme/copper-type cytochrome/quinol oxidase subunit 4